MLSTSDRYIMNVGDHEKVECSVSVRVNESVERPSYSVPSNVLIPLFNCRRTSTNR
jgi:hypothetical protein